MKNLVKTLVISCLLIINETLAQNPKFHIYLYLGQSNIESNAEFQPQDTQPLPIKLQ